MCQGASAYRPSRSVDGEIELYSWFDTGVASAINDLTWSTGHPYKAEGELKQLSRLFSAQYLRDLHAELMSKALKAGTISAYLSVELGYIDKMPFAKSTFLPKKTELGDVILVGLEKTVNAAGSPISSTARAVLLQAKVTDRYAQQSNPRVPIAQNIPGTSTHNELELLSSWPLFDLHERSNSKTSSLSNINLSAGRLPPHSFAWYLAAPRLRSQVKPSIHAAWPSWWMLGAAINFESCKAKFGDFLRAFLQGGQLSTSLGNLEVGASFDPVFTPTGSSNEWDKLCREIIRLVKKNPAPSSIFGSVATRVASTGRVPMYFLHHVLIDYNRHCFFEYTHRGYSIFDASLTRDGASRGAPIVMDLRFSRARRHNSERTRKAAVITFRSYRVEDERVAEAGP